MDNKQQTGTAAQTKNTGGSQSDKATKSENEKVDTQDVKQAVKETANKAVGGAKDKVIGIIDQKKTNLTTGLNEVADTIRKIGEDLRQNDGQTNVGKITANYGNSLADAVEDFSSYLEDAKIRNLTHDVEDFASRQPLLFIGGAFALGLLAARFLKSSNPSGISGEYLRNKNRLPKRSGGRYADSDAS